MSKKRANQFSYDDPPKDAHEEEYFVKVRPWYQDFKINEVSNKKELKPIFFGSLENRKHYPFLEALNHFGELGSDDAYKKIRGLKRKLGLFKITSEIRFGINGTNIHFGLNKTNLSAYRFLKILKGLDLPKPITDLNFFMESLLGPDICYGGGRLCFNMYEKNGKRRVKVIDNYEW